MKVDLALIPGQGSLKVEAKAGAFTDSLSEGDEVKALVISAGNRAAVIKTDGGHIVKARLGLDVKLVSGMQVLLEVSGKEKGIVSLSIIRADENPEAVQSEGTGQPAAAKEPPDKSLEPFERKLAELNIPVTKETARLMQELIALNPAMRLDEAAFLCSNRISGDVSLVKAAFATLSGGEKTDGMLTRLLTLLDLPETLPPNDQEFIKNAEFGIRNPELAQNPQFSAPQTVASFESVSGLVSPDSASGTQHLEFASVPLTDWLIQFQESDAGTETAAARVVQGYEESLKTIITQNNGDLQSTNVEKAENNDDNSHNNVQTLEQHVLTRGEGVINTPQNAPLTTLSSQISEQSAAPLSNQSPAHSIPPSQVPMTISGKVAELLSEIPEFHNTPKPLLERFSDMLLRVTRDNMSITDGDAGKLAALVDRLFTRIGRSDNNGGQRLRTAREELYARLALIEDEISRSSPPAKAEILEQTRRLMDHVRFLNSINQFTYMQLPVKMGDEHKTAELYLFKRKGGKRADPENVNILLALELENMGHWEALINFRQKDVSIKMEVRGEKEKECFSENTVMLHGLLAEAGFKLVGADIKCSLEEATPLTVLSSLKRYTNGRAGMIDYMI